ncbi:hypothetical protein SDC9_66719 [bioreactor metagenome]|uniref:Uncharacterized protein n=1 Tax=bioreactor metagenome TaxID=1076179 RepID=A0A644XVQ6_9ZZZZ
MPTNLIKVYNELLELLFLNEPQRIKSLTGIFERDIRNNRNFLFRQKSIYPTPAEDGDIAMEVLFNHLTRKTTNDDSKKRELDIERSCRLHWIRYHIEEKKKGNMLCFSTREPKGFRTYIYDKDEKYVIILEPRCNNTNYFLLTAYPLMGKDKARDKIMKKYRHRLNEVL